MDADTRALLDALERVREVRGSLPLYDALIRVDGVAFAQALAMHPRHPLRDDALAWMERRGIAPAAPPDATSRLLAYGIEDVDTYVATVRATERDLRARAADLAAEAARARQVANAASLVCVLLGILAAVGWAAVLGDLPFPRAVDPPSVDEVRARSQERK
jgi:hypothetical protein